MRVVANFDEPYLSSGKIIFDSVKSSWLPITRATTYVHLENLTLDPPPAPLILFVFLSIITYFSPGSISVSSLLVWFCSFITPYEIL